MIPGMTGDLEKESTAKMLAIITKIAKIDPEGATLILNREAEINPALAPCKGIVIKGNTKDNWMELDCPGGSGVTAYMVYLPKVSEAVQAGKGSEIWNATFIPFVGEDSVILNNPDLHRRRWFHA